MADNRRRLFGAKVGGGQTLARHKIIGPYIDRDILRPRCRSAHSLIRKALNVPGTARESSTPVFIRRSDGHDFIAGEEWTLDIARLDCLSDEGARPWLLTACSISTRRVVGEQVHARMGAAELQKDMTGWMSLGCPEVVVTDCGFPFISGELSNWLATFGISHRIIGTGDRASRQLLERAHRRFDAKSILPAGKPR